MVENVISDDEEHVGEGNQVIRRTITVDDYVNRAINYLRGNMLVASGQELDFTTMINMFAEIGILWFSKAGEKGDQALRDPIIKHITAKYWDKNNLQLAAIGDQLQDMLVKQKMQK